MLKERGKDNEFEGVAVLCENEAASKRFFESQAQDSGYRAVAGIDEAGRGPLAGPVVAAACIFPKGLSLEGVDDSKKLTPKKRDALFEKITSDSRISFAVAFADHQCIDRVNIYQATILAMKQAVDQLPIQADYLLVDGLDLVHTVPSLKIIKGDSRSESIGAASILAKVTRDRMMEDFDKRWPEYGFKAHKGYGTVRHLEALEKFGPCEIHRRSFEPIKSMVRNAQSIV